jgi:hypothetical protein
MLVSSFNLLQSFNYAPNLFCKKTVQIRDQLFLYTGPGGGEREIHGQCRENVLLGPKPDDSKKSLALIYLFTLWSLGT